MSSSARIDVRNLKRRLVVAKEQAPEIVTLGVAQLEQLLLELHALLPPATYQLVEGLLRTLQWVLGVIEEKKASLRRLRRIIFGAKTEKTANLFPKDQGASSAGQGGTQKATRKGKGHGQGH